MSEQCPLKAADGHVTDIVTWVTAHTSHPLRGENYLSTGEGEGGGEGEGRGGEGEGGGKGRGGEGEGGEIDSYYYKPQHI